MNILREEARDAISQGCFQLPAALGRRDSVSISRLPLGASGASSSLHAPLMLHLNSFITQPRGKPNSHLPDQSKGLTLPSQPITMHAQNYPMCSLTFYTQFTSRSLYSSIAAAYCTVPDTTTSTSAHHRVLATRGGRRERVAVAVAVVLVV